MGFSELQLNDALMRALGDLHFEEPTPIQAQAIPLLLEGDRDLVGLAQTGTGKTGAYGLPMLQLIKLEIRSPQGLIVCPTRELCMQIADDLRAFGRYMPALRITAVYGGASMSVQINELRRGAHIVVATPGRLLDLCRRGVVNLAGVTCAVLDEADEMLNMGFQEDIRAILDETPEEARIWLFSATMPRDVRAIANNYLRTPHEITVGTKNISATNISHTYYLVNDSQRYQALKRLIDASPDLYGLVFCRTRADTQFVADSLIRDGIITDALHGDLSQNQRDSVMRKFRARTLRVLIATDVAARGLDVDDLTHVIHYALPDDAMAYTHRSGRTARAGKSGESVVLLNPRETFRLRDLERMGQIRFSLARLPKGSDILKRKAADFAAALSDEKTLDETMGALAAVAKEALKDVDKDALIERLVMREFASSVAAYRGNEDINAEPFVRRAPTPYVPAGRRDQASTMQRGLAQRAWDRDDQSQGGGNRAYARFFINVGRLDKVNPGVIVRLVCDRTGIRSSSLGMIDMKREFSFFDVDVSVAERVRSGMRESMLDGRRLVVKDAHADRNAGGGRA